MGPRTDTGGFAGRVPYITSPVAVAAVTAAAAREDKSYRRLCLSCLPNCLPTGSPGPGCERTLTYRLRARHSLSAHPCCRWHGRGQGFESPKLHTKMPSQDIFDLERRMIVRCDRWASGGQRAVRPCAVRPRSAASSPERCGHYRCRPAPSTGANPTRRRRDRSRSARSACHGDGPTRLPPPGGVGRSRLGSATRVDAVSDHCAGVLGWMFLLLWNTFSGSYLAFTSASRRYMSSP